MKTEEAIEQIKKISEYPGTYPCAIVRTPNVIEVIKCIDAPQVTDEQAWNKIAEAYPETTQSLRITLDHAVYGQEAEPQKVKVPACVDKYLNFCMKIELSLTEALKREIPSGVYGPYPDDFKFIHETLEWLESPINQDIFADAWLHGWKVEEEPKWKIINDQKYCLTSIEAGYGNSLHWAFDSTKKKPILFDNEETALYTAYITGGTVEKV